MGKEGAGGKLRVIVDDVCSYKFCPQANLTIQFLDDTNKQLFKRSFTGITLGTYIELSNIDIFLKGEKK